MQEITQCSEVKCSHNGLERARQQREHRATSTTTVPGARPHLQAVFPVYPAAHGVLDQCAECSSIYTVYDVSTSA